MAVDGYKQTEAGVIPTDWINTTVGMLFKDGVIEKPMDGNHGNIHPKSTDFVSYGIPFVMANSIQSGRLDLENCSYIKKSQADNLQKGFAKAGDVLLTHKATIGNTAIVPKLGFEYIMLTPQVTYYRVKDEARLSNKYLRHSFDSSQFQRTMRLLSGGGTRAYIGISAQHSLPLALPPTKKEQEAIANALSDADALIESLEKLIAKKRLIKKGAMQELLTGKRRLPGFTVPWETDSFGNLFDLSGGFSASRDQLSNEGLCYLHYGDIHLSRKTFIDLETEFMEIPKLNIPISKVSPKSILKDGDIVFVDASEDEEGVSKHLVVNNNSDVPFISGLHTIVAKSKDRRVDRNFKRYCFQTARVRSQFRFFAVGTKVLGVSKTNISKVEIEFPALDEQKAIAAILMDLDQELFKLNAKLSKARLIKQGMMQELLTGRIRLI